MPQWDQLSTGQKALVILAIVAVIAIIALVIWFLISFPTVTAAIADVSIIVLAVGTFILDLILIFLIWQIIRLLMFLITELEPVLRDLQNTSTTVKGTATFVSDNVVNPAVEVAGKVAAVRASLNVLFRGPGSSRPASRPPSGGNPYGQQ